MMMILIALQLSAFASKSCDDLSGVFSTLSECRYSHDGVRYQREGHRTMQVNYRRSNTQLMVHLGTSVDAIFLSFVVNGEEQIGRAEYEGVRYAGECADNHITITSLMQQLKYPLVTEFFYQQEGKLLYRESMVGSSFVRECEMELE
ncbi:MAG: hypothetical protein LW878_04350 [Proteobacteria bacterium]|nr:hypothetical protein [Pseudomonadota bacterium]